MKLPNYIFEDHISLTLEMSKLEDAYENEDIGTIVIKRIYKKDDSFYSIEIRPEIFEEASKEWTRLPRQHDVAAIIVAYENNFITVGGIQYCDGYRLTRVTPYKVVNGKMRVTDLATTIPQEDMETAEKIRAFISKKYRSGEIQ
jgi:hypothetical protein